MMDTNTVVIDNTDKAPLGCPEWLLIRLGAKWSHEVIQYVPGFEYWRMHPQVRDYRNPQNRVGHQQRAFDFYWATRLCALNGRIGLGIGTTECIGICTFGTDKFCGVSPDPTRYGDSYGYPHMQVDANNPLPFYDGKFASVFCNHVIEHLDNPWFSIGEMLRVTDSGGVVCIVTPDMTHNRRGTIDPTHTYEFSADQFYAEWQREKSSLPAHELIEHNTFDNNFSFNVVLRKS